MPESDLVDDGRGGGVDLLQRGLRCRRMIQAIRGARERERIENAILLERQIVRQGSVCGAVCIAGEHAVLFGKGMVDAPVPLVLRLYREIVSAQVAHKARKIWESENLQQLQRDRIHPARGDQVVWKELARVGACVESAGVVYLDWSLISGAGGNPVEMAAAHARGRLGRKRGGR